MATTMKAVRFHGKEDIRIEQVPIPTCGPGQVKLKPSYVGICGSDLHEYLGGASIIPTTPHPITNEKAPLTLGHEFSGVIEEIGDGITDLVVGDNVTVQPIIFDGTCPACQEGYINCCESNGFVGLSGWGGGLSEHVVVPRKSVYKVPENIPMEVAALVEPLAVGWHAVKISPFKKGDAVLILGGGPIGLAVIQALAAKEASKIIVSEMAPKRKEFAQHFGASDIVDPSKEDVGKRVKELCGGVGVNVVFDCAGVQPALDTAILSLRPRGTLVNIAVWEKKATIWPSHFLFRERKYMGVATYQEGDYAEVLQAISSGNMKPGSMITKKINIDDVVAEGFQSLIHDKNNQVKILIDLT